MHIRFVCCIKPIKCFEELRTLSKCGHESKLLKLSKVTSNGRCRQVIPERLCAKLMFSSLTLQEEEEEVEEVSHCSFVRLSDEVRAGAECPSEAS